MGSTRSGTKQNALDSLLFFIELDTADPVVEEMLPFLKHRTPKVVAGTVHALTEIIHQYGAKTVSCKPLFKSLPALFSHADKNIRAEAQGLAIELYKWLGDGFKESLFPDLKPVQQKDLEAEFEKVKGEAPKQERYLRSQREAIERQQASGISTGGAAGGGNGGDGDEDEDEPMDLFDPVEILSKIPGNFNTQVASSKWKERKEALEELFTVLNVPKIQPDDFSDLVRTLAKTMKDANIQVVVIAANSVEALAKGLRTNFSKYQPVILGPMLERLREKKSTVSEALGKALDAVFMCTSLSDILEETLEFLKHKTPQVKIETAKFLSRCLKVTKVIPKPAEIKMIIEGSIKMLSDTQEPVRTEAAQILGIVMKIVGERTMTPFLESVDNIKKGKIHEFYEKAEVKAKPAKQAPPPPAAAAAPSGGSRPGGGAAPRVGPGSKSMVARKRAPSSAATNTTANTRARLDHNNSASSESGLGGARPKPALGSTRLGGASKGPTNGGPSSLSSSSSSGVSRRPGGAFGSPTKSRYADPSSSSMSSAPQSATASSSGFPGSSDMGASNSGRSTPASGNALARPGGLGRGLTGRSLTAQGRGGLTTTSVVDNGLSAQERQELEKLRTENQELQKEREHLQWQAQGFNSEKTHLMQEINNLQLKVSYSFHLVK